MIDILILTYNNMKTLPQVFEAIERFTDDKYKIYIMDNASTDKNFVKYIKGIKSKKVDVVFSRSNRGVGGGRNKLSKLSTSEFVMFLDSDMIVSPKWDYFMKNKIEHTLAGAVGGKFTLKDDIIHYNGGYIEIIDNYFLLAKEYDKLLALDDEKTYIPRECDWLAGGSMLVQKNVLKQVSYDKRYKIGFEDIDFSLQIKEKGYKLYNCPRTSFIHLSYLKERDYSMIRKNNIELLKSAILFTKKWGLNPIKSWHTDKIIFNHSISINEAKEIVQKVSKNNISKVIKKYAEFNSSVST